MKNVGKEKYKGGLKDGKKHGKGILRKPNGDMYEGVWEDDILHKGIFREAIFDSEGRGYCSIYEGELNNYRPHGVGTFRWIGGRVYEGEWKEGKRHGRGTHRTSLDDDDIPKGTGPNGANGMGVYEGEWKDDIPHGQGTLKSANGDVYVGFFENGVENGRGTKTYMSDGRVYEGEWKDGKRQGVGTCKSANGDIFTGEWKLGKRWHGEGIWTSQDMVHEEEWENGKRHMTGKYKRGKTQFGA